MRIVSESPDRLELEHRPWFTAGFVWLAGVLAVLAAFLREEGWTSVLLFVIGCGAIAVAWSLMPFLRIVFDRQTGTVSHHARRPFGSKLREISLAGVQSARVQGERGETGARLTRLALQTADGVVPLESGFWSDDRDEIAVTVNRWLHPGPDR